MLRPDCGYVPHSNKGPSWKMLQALERDAN